MVLRDRLHESGTIGWALKTTSIAIGFWFFNFTLEYWKDFNVLSRFMQKWIQPPAYVIMVCIESCFSIGWHTFIWWKNPPKCCSILVWIAGCWNSLLLSRNPKNNWCLSCIFGARLGGNLSILSSSIQGTSLIIWRIESPNSQKFSLRLKVTAVTK